MISFRQTMAIIVALQVAIVGFFVGAMAFPRLAGAHDWYDTECCNDKDCRAISGVRNGEPWSELTETDKGYQWTSSLTGKVYLFPYGSDKIKPSRDGDYHGCEIAVGEGPTAGASIPLCLYIPMMF